MKKIFFLLTLAVCCLQINGFAQKSRVGITGGLVLAKMRGEIGGVDQKGESKLGFHAGFIVDAPISKHFSFQPALQYVQKGQVAQESVIINQDKIETELRYLELPLNFVYNSNYYGNNFYIGAGPYAAFNLPSKIVTTLGGDGVKAEEDLAFGNTSSEDYRGVDFGVNAIIGMRSKSGIFLALNYSLGLRNLNPQGALLQGDIKNSYFGLNVGWLFSNK